MSHGYKRRWRDQDPLQPESRYLANRLEHSLQDALEICVDDDQNLKTEGTLSFGLTGSFIPSADTQKSDGQKFQLLKKFCIDSTIICLLMCNNLLARS